MFEIVNKSAKENKATYYSHADAWGSGHRVFVDAVGDILLIVDDGWVGSSCYHYNRNSYAEYPVTPIGPDEVLQIR